MKGFFHALCVTAACLACHLDSQDGWTIISPADNSVISNNANVSCSGDADSGGIDYSCSVIHKLGGNRGVITIISSQNGVSNSTSWSCTASLMSGNWPNGIHYVKLEPVGYSGPAIENKITFQDP